MGTKKKEVIVFLKKHKLLFTIIFLSLIGLILRLLFIWKHSTAFTYDQGRDLLDLREMWLLRKPRLIGANTSLHGVFYGPFWYWFSFPFYLLIGGHPLTSLIPLLLLSWLMPIIFFFLIENKRLGFILALVFIFSNSFFSHSIVALNTNPIIFIIPLILLFLARFYSSEKEIFLWLVMFSMATSFHFEPIIGLFLLPLFLITILIFKKVRLVWKQKRALAAFFIPFIPQIVFEFRHQFLQTNAFLNLITGKGSSLTPASGDLAYRFFDRLRVFQDIWINQSGGIILAILFLILIALPFYRRQQEKEIKFLFFLCLLTLAMFFVGFVLYPYALWPWYLSGVDALMLTLIGLGIFFLLNLRKRYFFLSVGILFIFIIINVIRYLPWPLEQGFSPDPANLRTRLKVVDLIYEDTNDKGFKVFTFAPYVYDYPYQYLIWWRAKTKYGYLPEEYTYLPNQPDYVSAKEAADKLIPSKKAECDYLIIEPFESQEKWYWDWRYRFPEARKIWEIGETRVEKLCD